MAMKNVFVIWWSETKAGRKQIWGVCKSLREAKSAVKDLERYRAGWFVVNEYKQVRSC
jgi:hypothetical protein